MLRNSVLSKMRAAPWLILLVGILAQPLTAQVPHPSQVFGFTPGDDNKLADYGQMVDYYQRLSASSDRVQMREIGTSVLGRPLLLLIISSVDNLERLEHWRDVSEKLARARIDAGLARELAKEGKSITWIDGGLHATEVAHAQMTTLLAHKVATEESAEMRRIRDNTILLLMPVMNPDGLDIVSSWYKRNLGTPFETTGPPWLYHYYVGHDNNRDWFMNNMPESKAVTDVLYNQWYPQIVYNHHQTGPSWTRIFIPPFSDPVNPNIHPGITTGVNLVGSAMANRFALKGMGGVVSRVIYSMWWNGGMRTVPYFHNMIGILTETSHATPTPRFYDPDSLPQFVAGRRGGGMPTTGTNIFYPLPWKGGESRFREPIEYMLTASMAVLRIATDMREHFLTSIYQMGRDAITKGEKEGPFAYVIPPQEWNAGEDFALANLLMTGGIEVHQAEKKFKIDDRSYPPGTLVIKSAQAFRPYLVDLLEKQTYPDRRSSAGGQPEPPYDLAGWTLPMQMGVQVDRAMKPFQADLAIVSGPLTPTPGEINGNAKYGYKFSQRHNAGFMAANRLLADGESVHRIAATATGKNKNERPGTFVVTSDGQGTHDRVAKLAAELGLDFDGIKKAPEEMTKLSRPSIGLYKSWSSNMDEGWTRWLLTEYAFQHDTLHDADIQSSDLSRYHAIVIPHQSTSGILSGHAPGTMPDPFVGGLGAEGVLALKKYVQNGGTLVTLDGASDFAIEQLSLPVRNSVANTSSRQFFIPGSLVRIVIEQDHPLAYGMPETTAASFVRSRAFEIIRRSRKREGGRENIPAAPDPPVDIIARYAKEDILMSGWALGEEQYIGGKAALMTVQLGEGKVVLFGFRPQFRGQTRGTYKLFFNALLNTTLSSGAGRDEVVKGS